MSRKSLVASLAIFPLAGAVAGGRHAPDRRGLKDGFLATLSHELRTPPNAIVGWAHLLQRGQLAPDEVSRAIDTILRSATAQTQIIDELLDVSRIVTGKLQLDLRTGSLSSAVCVCCRSTAAARSRRRRCRHMLGRKIVAKHSWPDSSTTFQSP
jgi:signal transduction histidine kinase